MYFMLGTEKLTVSINLLSHPVYLLVYYITFYMQMLLLMIFDEELQFSFIFTGMHASKKDNVTAKRYL
jgi:hypothetical protein